MPRRSGAARPSRNALRFRSRRLTSPVTHEGSGAPSKPPRSEMRPSSAGVWVLCPHVMAEHPILLRAIAPCSSFRLSPVRLPVGTEPLRQRSAKPRGGICPKNRCSRSSPQARPFEAGIALHDCLICLSAVGQWLFKPERPRRGRKGERPLSGTQRVLASDRPRSPEIGDADPVSQLPSPRSHAGRALEGSRHVALVGEAACQRNVSQR